MHASVSSDDAIRATNDDASACKLCAVKLGYWQDPYLRFLVRSSERKTPEINRGYFARVQGVRILLEQFLQLTGGKCQIVNLGAGFDTLWWRLKDSGATFVNYVEVDFHNVTAHKCHMIKKCKPLMHTLSSEGDVSFTQHDMHSKSYHIVAGDLRETSLLDTKLTECGLDRNLPTLFLSECVLVYLAADQSRNLLQWITGTFSSCFFINYEQVNMFDRFGDVMVANLRMRNCTLHGIQYCESLESQKKRFQDTGWEGVEAWSMNFVYKNLPGAELHRIERLEMLDECELLDQLFEHYCITWAFKDNSTLGLATLSLESQ